MCRAKERWGRNSQTAGLEEDQRADLLMRWKRTGFHSLSERRGCRGEAYMEALTQIASVSLSCSLHFFVVTFHPNWSNQRVAFQSWGLLQVSFYIGKSFLVTAALCLLWRHQLVIFLILQSASKHLWMWFSVFQINLTDWFIDWSVDWILLGTFLNMFSIVLTLRLLFWWTKASVMVIESPSNSYFDRWVHVQQVITSLSVITPHPIHF